MHHKKFNDDKKNSGGIGAGHDQKFAFDWIALYRAARLMRPGEFAMHGFDWLRQCIAFDQGVIVSSLKNQPTWIDAHFSGVTDPKALMESHSKVRELDVSSKRMLEEPFRAHRINIDDPEIAGPRFKPFRDHLMRFQGIHVVNIAIPIDGGAISSVIMLVRGTFGRRFTDSELELLESFAPQFAEAAAVNRLRWLSCDRASDNDAMPIALLNRDGRLIQTTSEFNRLFWVDIPPDSAYLAEPILTALRKGRAWPLPDSKYSLYGQSDEWGGWLLRIRKSSPLDRLSPRERQIAGLFARGSSAKGIAQELALSPATVRNHLQSIYEKLSVSSRDDLIEMFSQQ
ncbi:MAG TPA: hypothetical protein DF383_05545 [Deltaproteobacteria bacterium]|nr:hypothetical protein [Deltaproteobacteria bacterium]